MMTVLREGESDTGPEQAFCGWLRQLALVIWNSSSFDFCMSDVDVVEDELEVSEPEGMDVPRAKELGVPASDIWPNVRSTSSTLDSPSHVNHVSWRIGADVSEESESVVLSNDAVNPERPEVVLVEAW